VEAYASGSGFIRRLQTALEDKTPTVLAQETGGDASRLTAVLVARAAAAGDPFAVFLWEDALRFLGAALANYVTLLNPELLVLGGGVMITVPSLAESLTERIRKHATMMSRDLRVVRAGLGDSAGIFGAADRVWRQE
jgi:glucokinase